MKKTLLFVVMSLILAFNTNAYPERIVSIAPSNTEILFALGLEDRIVGVTDYCDYPEEAKDKPKVGGFSNPSIETIVSLNPDVVFATRGVQADLVESLNDLNITVYQVNIQNIDDVLTEIQNIGDFTGQINEAKALVSGLRNRINAVEEKTRVLPESEKQNVYIEVWTYWTSGRNTFAYDLINKAGGNNPFDIDQGWFLTNAENVINANPDVILLAYHGEYADPAIIKSREGFEFINAVKNNKIYNIHPDASVRAGPRLADSLEEIALVLYPGLMNLFLIEPTTLTLNGNLDSDVSGEIKITNTGISNDEISISADIDSKYKISFSSDSFSLNKGESKSIAINAFIPKGEEIKAKLIGTVYLTGKDYSNSFLLYVSPNNNLRISDIDAYVDEKKDSKIDETGGKIDDVLPGSTIKLIIKVANDHEDNIEIKDIVVSTTLYDIDGKDIEEESDEFDLESGKSEKITLTFDIPYDVEEDDYELDVKVEGEDENGIEYSSIVKLEIKVEKEKNHVIIQSIKINPESISCQRNIKLHSKITNIGRNDENVKLLIQNSELGIDLEKNFEIEEMESVETDFSLDLIDDIPNGDYNIDITIDYKDNQKTDKASLTLSVDNCVGGVGNNNEKNNNEKLLTKNQIKSEEISNSKEKITAPITQSITDKNSDNTKLSRILLFVFFGAIFIILLCALILILVIKNERNKK